MTPSTLHQEATRLAAQLEQILDDPAADADDFLHLVDRYADVLDALRQTRPKGGSTSHSPPGETDSAGVHRGVGFL